MRREGRSKVGQDRREQPAARGQHVAAADVENVLDEDREAVVLGFLALAGDRVAPRARKVVDVRQHQGDAAGPRVHLGMESNKLGAQVELLRAGERGVQMRPRRVLR